MTSVSIIICTHNHCPSLRQTIEALGRVRVPAGTEVELLLVENASSDGTADYVETVRVPGMRVRALHEPLKGQVRARNLGLREAGGEIIVFTDDDVRPAADWLERIVARLESGESDALIGRISLAPQLERPWMDRVLRAGLAASEGLEDGWLTEMIGANMAFHRRVLEKVPRFDEELGPGALGFGDDTLFSWQLVQAGFRLGRAPEASVEHHCEASRLLRRSYLDAARKSGQSRAYLRHHWQHDSDPLAPLRLRLAQLKLLRRRMFSRADTQRTEGCARWELSLNKEIAEHRQFILERRRPRNYVRCGLVKLTAPRSAASSPANAT